MTGRLRRSVRSLGWADGILYIASSVVRRLSFGSARLLKYYFVAQPVASPPTQKAHAAPSIRMYIAEGPDAVLAQAPRPAAVIADRFAQHARCVAAERDGQLAGFIWLCPEQYVEDEVRCIYRWTPSAAGMWDFDVFVMPPFRMGRLFSRLWERAHGQLHAAGVKWTLSRIDAFNAGSLASHRRLGARNLACGWFLVVGDLQIAIFSVRPFWHFSFRDERRPTLCFDLSALPTEPTVPKAGTN